MQHLHKGHSKSSSPPASQSSTFAILVPETPTPTLPDETFFDADHYPQDEEAFLTFTERLERDANASRERVRSGHPYPIHILARWRSFDFPWLHPGSESPAHRHVPPALRSKAFIDDDANISITLKHPLQNGFCKWAQVWRADMRVTPPGASVSDASASQAAPVVIKVFQESAFRPPEYFDECGIESGYWPTGAKQARAEAWAYGCMRSLQGREVPWLYGCFKVRLPHGELAYAHVMEYIDGRSCRRTSLRAREDRNLWSLMDAMAACLYAVTKCGVVQKDVTCSNMIIRRDAAQPVVFVDFASMKPLRRPPHTPAAVCTGPADADPEQIAWDLANDVASLVRAFREMAVQMPDIVAWLKDRTRRGAPWMHLFSFLSEKMPKWYDLFAIETDEFVALNSDSEQERC